MAPGNYRPDGSPIIGISPHRLTGQGGITNTLDLGAGQKIQDYLAGAGVSNQGPGGGTLYTAGGGTAAGGGTIPIPGYNRRDPNYMENQIAVHNIDDQGNITGQTGLSRVVAKYGNIKDLNSFSPELQAAIQSYQNPRPLIDPGRYPTFGNANLGFGSVENPLGPAGPGVGGVIPETGQQLLLPEGYNPSFNPGDTSEVGGPKIPDPRDEIIQKMPFDQRPGGSNFSPFDVPLFGEQEDTGVGMPVGTETTDSFGIGSNPIMNNPIAPMPSMPTAPNTQPGHSHDDLLSGIGKLFEQYFPQQGSQQINQPSPMFDAAGNSVPDGQTQSNQVFGNMITPNFGGGY